MFQKIFKIILLSGKSYLLFIFIAMFLSIFSYMLSSNIILSVNSYLSDQVKPLLGGDVVLFADSDIVDESFLGEYEDDFYISQTIEVSTTIFDSDRNPSLIQLVYKDENYPVYDEFSYNIINPAGTIIVSQELYDTFGSTINIFEKPYEVLWILNKTPLGSIWFFSNFEKVYLPLSEFNSSLNSSNSRLDYEIYMKFLSEYDSSKVEKLKDDIRFENVRIRSLEDRNESIGDITDRLYLFINFFNLIIFILTFFITILSLETFYKKLKNTIGLLSILWLKKSRIFFYTLAVLFCICAVALLLASVLNLFVIELLRGYYDFFSIYSLSFFKSLGVMLVVLFIGVYSPFYKVYVSDIQWLLSDNSFFSRFWPRDYLIYVSLIGLWFLCISIISGISYFLSITYSIWFILLIVLLYICISILLKIFFGICGKYISRQKNFYFFDAIRSTVRPGNVSFLIIFSSIISFASIFIFTVFSWSFLSFLHDLNSESNDTFVINVSKDYEEISYDFFNQDEIYEIVPLRIKEINSQDLSTHLWSENTSWRFSREFQSLNRSLDEFIEKWDTLSSWGVSLDAEFAADIWVDIGDTILFTTAGLDKKLIVQNIRKAERDGINPFFYFSLYQDDFERFPKTYFISYDSRSKPENIQFDYSNATDGSVSFIDTGEIIAIVLDVASKILLIVYLCLWYIYIFSLLTFLVSISFLRTFKTPKIKLLYLLGAWKKSLLRWVFYEYTYLIVFGLIFSIALGSLWLYTLSVFIDFFSLSLYSYIMGIAISSILLSIMIFYIYFSKKDL